MVFCHPEIRTLFALNRVLDLKTFDPSVPWRKQDAGRLIVNASISRLLITAGTLVAFDRLSQYS
jgi:hypothetical protein